MTDMPGRAEALQATAYATRADRSLLRNALRLAARKPLGAAGFVTILAFLVMALGATWLAPFEANEQTYTAILVPPNSTYLMGTDELGRDLLSRVMYGARVSLIVGFASVALGIAHGTFWGAVSGYFQGPLDYIVQRVMDAFMAIPFLVLALTLVAMAGPSLRNVVLALAIGLTPSSNRVVRATVLSAKQNQYVEAARSIGSRDARILFRHILPNVFAPIIVIATVALGNAIIAEASLSFLGLGAAPPNTSWGAILSGSGRQYLEQAPWIAVFPGVGIALVVLSFNMLGDALRDILDPRLRG